MYLRPILTLREGEEGSLRRPGEFDLEPPPPLGLVGVLLLLLLWPSPCVRPSAVDVGDEEEEEPSAEEEGEEEGNSEAN